MFAYEIPQHTETLEEQESEIQQIRAELAERKAALDVDYLDDDEEQVMWGTETLDEARPATLTSEESE